MTFKSLLDFQPDQGYLVEEQCSEFSRCRVGRQSSIQRSNLSGDPSSPLPGEEAALPASLAVELLPTVLPDLVAVLPVPAQAAHGRRGPAGRRSALQVFFFQTFTSPSLISDVWTQPWSSVTSFPKRKQILRRGSCLYSICCLLFSFELSKTIFLQTLECRRAGPSQVVTIMT